MRERKVKWLIYTVLVGLIPIFARVLAFIVTEKGAVGLPTAQEFVALGLVLHISNINELEHYNIGDKTWKTVQNGISVVFIAFYSILFTFTLIGNSGLVNENSISYCAGTLACVSLLLSYSVYDHVSKRDSL